MAVEWEDLTVPTGEIDVATLFPDDTDDGEARLTGYLTIAATKATTDAGITAYAYHLAYRAVWVRLSANPSSAAIVNEESVSWSAAQIAAFKLLSDEKLEEFEDTVEDTDDSDGWSVITSLRHAG